MLGRSLGFAVGNMLGVLEDCPEGFDEGAWLGVKEGTSEGV